MHDDLVVNASKIVLTLAVVGVAALRFAASRALPRLSRRYMAAPAASPRALDLVVARLVEGVGNVDVLPTTRPDASRSLDPQMPVAR